MKICTSCKEEYLNPKENFHKDKKTPDGLVCYCKLCAKQKVKKWGSQNPERRKINRRKYYLKRSEYIYSKKKERIERIGKEAAKIENNRNSRRYQLKKYGLTLDYYENLLKSQNFRCQICKQEFGNRGPQIDHCHKTGKFRGILCTLCNISLGHIEKEGFLDKALDYLRKV